MRIETTDRGNHTRTPAGFGIEGPWNVNFGSGSRGEPELLMRPPGAIGRPVFTVKKTGRAAEVAPAARVRREGVVTGEVVSRRVGFENSDPMLPGRGASWLSETGLVGSSSGALSLGSSRGRTSSHRAWMCRPLECGHSNSVIPVDRDAASRALHHGIRRTESRRAASRTVGLWFECSRAERSRPLEARGTKGRPSSTPDRRVTPPNLWSRQARGTRFHERTSHGARLRTIDNFRKGGRTSLGLGPCVTAGLSMR